MVSKAAEEPQDARRVHGAAAGARVRGQRHILGTAGRVQRGSRLRPVWRRATGPDARSASRAQAFRRLDHHLQRARAPGTVDRQAGRRAARVSASGSVWPNQMPSAGCRLVRSFSFRCFSPTSRCDTISTSSLKVGGAKPWPQTSRVQRVDRSTAVNSAPSGPSVRSRRVSVAASSHSCATCAAPARRCRSAPGDGAARRHRMAAEAQQHARVPLGDEVERVAQVKAGDRAAGALQSAPSGAAGAKTKVGRCNGP